MKIRALFGLLIGGGIGFGLAACFPDPSEACANQVKPVCCLTCTSDQRVEPACVDDEWKCPRASVPESACDAGPTPFCTAAGQADGGRGSSLRVCADLDASICLGGCDPGEICFTQVTCTSPNDAGTCAVGATRPGDNRCHRLCDAGCSSDELCVAPFFFGCTDFNGQVPICCGDGGCQN